MACPGNRYKLDEVNGNLVCDCDQSDDYWKSSMSGLCELTKTTCDSGEDGRERCSKRDALCQLDVNDITGFECECPLGKKYQDLKQVKSAKELNSNQQFACMDVCQLPPFENKCASIGAKCNTYKLWKLFVDNEENPREVVKHSRIIDYCTCVPGTFYNKDLDLCVQEKEIIELQMEYVWTHQLERFSDDETKTYLTRKVDRRTSVKGGSKFSAEELDPEHFASLEVGVYEKNGDDSELFVREMYEMMQTELIATQTQILLTDFEKVREENDVQVISVKRHNTTEKVFEVMVTIKKKSFNPLIDFPNKQSDNFTSIKTHCFKNNQECIIPYTALPVILNGDQIAHRHFEVRFELDGFQI